MSDRGVVKLKKGLIGNLHPSLSFLDNEDLLFQGWFDLDNKFFFIEYGSINRGQYEKAILSTDANSIAKDIKNWRKENA